LINGEIQQTIDLDYKSLSYSELSGRYEATIEASYFDRPGKYTIFFYVKEDNDIVLPTQWLFVYKPKDNNLPPSHFSLKSPENESTVRTSTILSWESAYETDQLSYSIFLYKKKLSPHHLEKIEKHGIEELMYSIDLPETWDTYRTYWFVRAIDEFGSYTDSDIWSFHLNNTGIEDCFIKGYVYDACTNLLMESATILLENKYFDKGHYYGYYFEGTYRIKVFCDHYTRSLSFFFLTEKKLKNQYNIKKIIKKVGQSLANYTVGTKFIY